MARLAPASLLLDVGGARAGCWSPSASAGTCSSRATAAQSWTPGRRADAAPCSPGVCMHDARLGWAVGHDEVVLRTRDGGADLGARPLRARSARGRCSTSGSPTPRRGLAVGAYGGLLVTGDGGDTWDAAAGARRGRLPPEPDRRRRRRHALPRGRGRSPLPLRRPGRDLAAAAVALRGLVLRPAAARRTASLLAFGLRGHLFRSPDRGRPGRAIETGTEATLTCALELGAGRFVVGGLAGTLLWSDDGGRGGPHAGAARPAGHRRARAGRSPARLLLVGEGGVQTCRDSPLTPQPQPCRSPRSPLASRD